MEIDPLNKPLKPETDNERQSGPAIKMHGTDSETAAIEPGAICLTPYADQDNRVLSPIGKSTSVPLQPPMCPKCGKEMECCRSMSVNYVDLCGSLVLLTFFLTIILFFVGGLDLYGLVLVVIILIILGVAVALGWHKKTLNDPVINSGIFSEIWIVAGVVFVLQTILRYFMGVTFSSDRVCKKCNPLKEKNHGH